MIRNCFYFFRIAITNVLIVISVSGGIVAQSSDSTKQLFVAASSGLIVRFNPTTKSDQVRKIEFNEEIEVSKTKFIDTIDNRISNWYKIIGERNQYVFGGYLNEYKLPDTINGVLNDYLPEFAKNFGELKGLKYNVIPSNDEKGIGAITFKSNDRVSVVIKSGYEYSKIEYYFKNLSINEFINLFEIMKVYRGYEKLTLVPKFEKGRFIKFSYSIPDAGMGVNEIIQINETDVLVNFEYSL